MRKNKKISPEDMEIIEALEALKEDIDTVSNCLDYVTDPLLIDSYILELESTQLKYRFYLQLCKERGLMADFPVCDSAASSLAMREVAYAAGYFQQRRGAMC